MALVFAAMRLAAKGSLWGCLLALALTAPAQADPGVAPARPSFTAHERSALRTGQMVSRELRFEQSGGHYVGGVSYQVVDAQPELVLAALSDVSNWPEAL